METNLEPSNDSDQTPSPHTPRKFDQMKRELSKILEEEDMDSASPPSDAPTET
jgi:hypothetical protein